MPGPALAILFAAGWIPLYLWRAEATQEAMPFYAPQEKLWVRLSPVIVALHVSAACLALSLSSAVPAWRATLGITMFAAAVGFWVWARSLIGPVRVRRLPDEAPTALCRNGPFGVVRNPLNFAVLVAAAAPAVTAGRSFLLVTYLPCVVALAIRAAQEERRLHAQLGAPYAEYCASVKRLVPFIW